MSDSPRPVKMRVNARVNVVHYERKWPEIARSVFRAQRPRKVTSGIAVRLNEAYVTVAARENTFLRRRRRRPR